MTQVLLKSKPTYVDTDTAPNIMKPGAAAYLKNYRNNFNKNQSGIEGGNFGVGTPLQSTLQTVKVNLPEGINKKCGGAEIPETNEYYYMNWNSNNYFGIYRINGNTLTCDMVIVDPILNFSIDPKFFMDPTRITLKVIYLTDSNGVKKVFEKFLIITDSNNWQFWINVESAIATQGFNQDLFPYFQVKYPHFDKKELIQYASRPPMFPAVVNEIPYTTLDAGKENSLLNKSTQFAYRYIYTDGRSTNLSAYSTPYFLSPSACNITNRGLPRGLRLTLYAGGPLVEKIQILKRNCNGDFVLYDTISKFDTCGANSPENIGLDYWKRTNPFMVSSSESDTQNYEYDNNSNTIKYNYYGDKESLPIDNSLGGDTAFQTSLPIKSGALGDPGDAILFSRNLKNYNNLDCTTLDSIKLEVVPGSDNGGCPIKTVKISVYAYLGKNGFINQMVYTKNNDENSEHFFGGFNWYNILVGNINGAVVTVDQNIATSFNLSLGSKTGFVGYLAGTSYYAISKQYVRTSSGSLIEVGAFNVNDAGDIETIQNYIRDGAYFLQKFDFVVPAGNYLFRMAGHGASVNSNFELTSTYVMGTVNSSAIVNSNYPFNFYDGGKGIRIFACNGDVDTLKTAGPQILVVFTPFNDNTLGNQDNWRFVDGYFRESSTSTVGMGQAAYKLRLGRNSSKRSGGVTDHNGFFFAYASNDRADQGEVVFDYYWYCSYAQERAHTNINQKEVSGYFANQNINLTDVSGGVLAKQNRVHIRGKITNCEGGAGVSGIGVTLTGSQTFYSDGDGNFEINTHADGSGSRSGDIFFNASGQCIFTECDCTCVPVLPFNFGLVPCVDGQDRDYPVLITKSIKLATQKTKTLKGGGHYGIVLLGWDDAERAGYGNLLKYVDIPTFLEKGNFNPSQIKWSLLGPLNLPYWVRSISFAITRNLNFKSYLQWVGDKIEFIDTNGNIVADGSGAIRARVTIQSLLDFNLANNYATTVGYQFVQGDQIRFYDNGSGDLFTPDPVSGFMDYPILGSNFNESVEGQISVATTDSDTTTTTTTSSPITQSDGKSFIIPYDSRLQTLKGKCGFWIELIRPNDETSVEIYGEVSGKYPVKNGELMEGVVGGTLDAFDTYYQTRTIPIELCSGKAFLHPFESQSITDFWGEGCTSLGRITVSDPDVKQYWDENEVTKSDEFVNNGRVNGIGTFRGKTSRFPGQKRGAIVAMHAETKLIVFICENDVFVTSYNQNYVQAAGNQGFVTVNLDNIIGEAIPKSGITHGCAEEDRGTIIFEKGIGIWLDRKNAAQAIFAYSGTGSSLPEDITQENKSWFINKCSHLIKFNKTTPSYLGNLIETSAGYDPQHNDYILTLRPRRNLSTNFNNFVNNERETKVDMQETFVFNFDQKKWTYFTGFTPESYGTLRSALSGKQLISFVNGLPYFHNTENVANFNTFYGIKTETVIEPVFSGIDGGLDDKVKVNQSLLIKNTGALFFCDRIITDNKKAYGYIPLVYWKKVFGIQYATILADGNTYPDPSHPVPSQLVDGNQMTGLYAKVRIISNPNSLDGYFEIDKITIRVTGQEKSDK